MWLIDDSKLEDITSLAEATPALVDLNINHCRRIADIEVLAAQTELEKVALLDGGRIRSLRPLAGLPRLEQLYFYGTTLIEDGDLSFLLDMPSLKRTSFANRRHYSHRREDIEAELARRYPNEQSPPSIPHWWW